MKRDERKFLFELLDQASPTGFEMGGQRLWARHLKPVADEVACDAYGSTWAKLAGKGKGAKTVMLEAHADEIGYMVKHVTEDGFLRLDRIGGSDAAIGRGRRVRVLGAKGEVVGVIGNTAIHLRRDETDSKVPQVHELWVDVGAASAAEVAGMGIRVGHPVIYQEGAMELANKRLAGRALDNRLGSFIIAEVLKRIAAGKPKPAYHLVCLNAVQEEIGGHGAVMAVERLKPDLCICLDVTHATDTPGIDHSKHGAVKLGGGPSVTHGTANHPLVVERLIEVAEKYKIPLQHEASSRFTGTDTDQIYRMRGGIPCALVSLPLRCMHSVVETVHLDDVERTIELLAAFVLSLKAADSFDQVL
jgi:putative aminopeptidase FrvX